MSRQSYLSSGMGDRARAAREARGISREHLAREVDVSLSTIVRLELHDQPPRMRIFIRIAAALDASLDWLAFGDRTKDAELPFSEAS